MKKLLVVLLLMFANVSFAETINVNWKVDNTTYTTSTCEAGGNLIIPQTPPTKYGYTFVGWNYGVIKGTWSQSGTPTPSTPIEPEFYQLGNTVLRALGSGEIFIADEYNPSTEKITRYVGVKVLDGTELWREVSGDAPYVISIPDMVGPTSADSYTVWTLNTHFIVIARTPSWSQYSNLCSTNTGRSDVQFRCLDNQSTLADFKQFLSDQYAAGTPVTIYYPLAEPVEESWSL